MSLRQAVRARLALWPALGWLAFTLGACSGGRVTPAPPPSVAPVAYPIDVTASAACVLGGAIYVTGGWGDRDERGVGHFTPKAYRYEPRTNRWEPLPDMPRGRCFHTCVALAGKVWLFGGVVGSGGTAGEVTASEVDCYDPAHGAWSTPTSLPTARNRLSGVAVGGQVMVLGGRTNEGNTNVVEALNAAGEWTVQTPLPQACHGMSVAHVGGHVLAIGGDAHPRELWIYRLEQGTWTQGAALPRPALFACAVAQGEVVYVLGGRYPGSDALLRYEAGSGTWEEVGVSSLPTSRATAVALEGCIYVIGGEDAEGNELSRVSRLELATGQWLHSD